ncbi:unnamed protein product, partial [Tenebrio molitor]
PIFNSILSLTPQSLHLHRDYSTFFLHWNVLISSQVNEY